MPALWMSCLSRRRQDGHDRCHRHLSGLSTSRGAGPLASAPRARGRAGMYDREMARARGGQDHCRRVRHGAYVVEHDVVRAVTRWGPTPLSVRTVCRAGLDRDRLLARERRGRMGHRTVATFHSIRCTSPGTTSEQVGTRQACTSDLGALRERTSCSAMGSGSPVLRVRVSTRSPWSTSSTVRCVVNRRPEQAGSDRRRIWRSAQALQGAIARQRCGTGSCCRLADGRAESVGGVAVASTCATKLGLPAAEPSVMRSTTTNGRLVYRLSTSPARSSDASGPSTTVRSSTGLRTGTARRSLTSSVRESKRERTGTSRSPVKVSASMRPRRSRRHRRALRAAACVVARRTARPPHFVPRRLALIDAETSLLAAQKSPVSAVTVGRTRPGVSGVRGLEAAARSRNQMVSSVPVTPAAGQSWRSVPSARARATAGAFSLAADEEPDRLGAVEGAEGEADALRRRLG